MGIFAPRELYPSLRFIGTRSFHVLFANTAETRGSANSVVKSVRGKTAQYAARHDDNQDRRAYGSKEYIQSLLVYALTFPNDPNNSSSK